MRYLPLFLVLFAIGYGADIDSVAELETWLDGGGIADSTIAPGTYELISTGTRNVSGSLTVEGIGDVIIDCKDTYFLFNYGNGCTISFVGSASTGSIKFKDVKYGYRVRDGSGSFTGNFTYCQWYGTEGANSFRITDNNWQGDCTVTFNNCKMYDGQRDGFSMEGDAGGTGCIMRATFNNCEFYDNGGDANQGDGITAHRFGQILIANNCTFHGNDKTGAALVNGAQLIATDCTFYDNGDTAFGTGQVWMNGEVGLYGGEVTSICTLTDCTFSVTAGQDPNVYSNNLVAIIDSDAIITGCTFNGENLHTGTMVDVRTYMYDGSIPLHQVMIKNNKFINSAQSSSGKIISIYHTGAFGIFANNWINGGYDLFYLNSENVSIFNNIFQGALNDGIDCQIAQAYSQSYSNRRNIFSNITGDNLNNDTGGIKTSDLESGQGPTVILGEIVYGLESTSTGALFNGLYSDADQDGCISMDDLVHLANMWLYCLENR